MRCPKCGGLMIPDLYDGSTCLNCGYLPTIPDPLPNTIIPRCGHHKGTLRAGRPNRNYGARLPVDDIRARAYA